MRYLKSRLIMVPVVPCTASELVGALFQVSVLPGIKNNRANSNAVRAVTFILVDLYVNFKVRELVSLVGEKVEEKLHPHSAFMTGFVRTMGNLGVLAWWIVLSIYFISHKWVDPSLGGKGACVAGVALGTSVWFSGLGYAVSLGHGKFKDSTLLRIERGSGIILLLLGLADGIKILLEMRAKH